MRNALTLKTILIFYLYGQMINLFDTYMYLHVVFLAADELTGFSIYSGASLERPPYWPQKCGL